MVSSNSILQAARHAEKEANNADFFPRQNVNKWPFLYLHEALASCMNAGCSGTSSGKVSGLRAIFGVPVSLPLFSTASAASISGFSVSSFPITGPPKVPALLEGPLKGTDFRWILMVFKLIIPLCSLPEFFIAR